MGGFNSEDISDTPSNSDDRSFLTHLNDINIDPDAVISDGIILDVANIYASQKEPIEPFLEKRLSDIAQHLQSHAENEVSFSDAAAVHKASFGETINENIMNAEAIRNQLSTPEGRVYLLSLMVQKR